MSWFQMCTIRNLTYDTPNDLLTTYNSGRRIHQNSGSLTKNKTLIAKLEWAGPDLECW